MSETYTYYPPLNGAFVVVTFAMRVLMMYSREKKRWELPGGGQENHEFLIETAIREAKEETRVRLKKKNMIWVGTFIQKVPVQGNEKFKDGRVDLFQSQVFEFPDALIDVSPRDDFGTVISKIIRCPIVTEEAQQVEFIEVDRLLNGTLEVPLGHKRLLAHWLNWTKETSKKKTGEVSQKSTESGVIRTRLKFEVKTVLPGSKKQVTW